MNVNGQFNLFNVFIFVNRHNDFLPMMPCSLLSQNIINREKPWFLLQLYILNFVFMFLWSEKCKLESIITTSFTPPSLKCRCTSSLFKLEAEKF